MRLEHTIEGSVQVSGSRTGSRVKLTAIVENDQSEWPIHIEGDPKHVWQLLKKFVAALEALEDAPGDARTRIETASPHPANRAPILPSAYVFVSFEGGSKTLAEAIAVKRREIDRDWPHRMVCGYCHGCALNMALDALESADD